MLRLRKADDGAIRKVAVNCFERIMIIRWSCGESVALPDFADNARPDREAILSSGSPKI